MATPKQTAANRTNAQKSSGPRTTAGKATSRFNALKHGIYAVHQIMFDEKPEDLAELCRRIPRAMQPCRCQAAPPRRYHGSQRMAPSPLAPRRSRALADRPQHLHSKKISRQPRHALPATRSRTDSAIFERLQRVVNACERAYYRAQPTTWNASRKWRRKWRGPMACEPGIPKPSLR